jgi:hypothetical protein
MWAFGERRIILGLILKTMGIDIYAKWRNQTRAEAKAQMTGFSVLHGHVGYLREAYHGGPYATRYLVREAFEQGGEAQIPAAILRRRLPKTLELAWERERLIYGHYDREATEGATKSFVDFVELCEGKERAAGEPVTIVASF